MKSLFLLACAVSTLSTAAMAADQCSAKQLIEAIQKECPNVERTAPGDIRWVLGKNFFQGEGGDSYDIPVKNSESGHQKVMRVSGDSGDCSAFNISAANCPK